MDRYAGAVPLTKAESGALFTKYVNLAREIGWKLQKKYGYQHHDLVNEAVSVLGRVVMEKGHLIKCVPARETTCIYRLVSWNLLSMLRRPHPIHKHERINPNTRRMVCDKRSNHVPEAPPGLEGIRDLVLSDPEEFVCRGGVIKYANAPIPKYLKGMGVPEETAVEVQIELERHYA